MLQRKQAPTQAMWTSREVVLSVENKLCRIELQVSQGIASKTVDLVSAASAVCYENCSQHSAQFKFYTGLTVPQFIHWFSSLGTAVDNLAYYKSKGSGKRQRIKTKMKLSLQNQLFLTLVRLRVGLLHKNLAYRFKLSIFNTVDYRHYTWIQLLYRLFKHNYTNNYVQIVFKLHSVLICALFTSLHGYMLGTYFIFTCTLLPNTLLTYLIVN